MTDDEEIRQAIRQVARDGKAGCKELLSIAERLGVEADRVGRICDEMGLRIARCQLGCFG